MSRLVVLELVSTCCEGEKFRRATDETSRTEVSLKMLSKVVTATEELAACLDGTFVRTFLSVGAVVTFEVLHTLEALTAVADMKLVGGGDDEGRRTGVTCSTTRGSARDGAGHRTRTTIEP